MISKAKNLFKNQYLHEKVNQYLKNESTNLIKNLPLIDKSEMPDYSKDPLEWRWSKYID
jgi:hypothetical protein